MKKNGAAQRKRPAFEEDKGGNDSNDSKSPVKTLAISEESQKTNISAESAVDAAAVHHFSAGMQGQDPLPLSLLRAGTRNIDFEDRLAASSINLLQQRLRPESTTQFNFLQERIGGLRGLEPANLETSSPPPLNLRREEDRRDALPQSRLWLALQQQPADVPSLETSQRSTSAQPQREDNSNRKRKPSRLPCRARGMPEDHDYSSAYFEISSDIKHGDPLVCSFVKCRNEGIKFLYCDVCRDAVGRRVFRNQHHHLDQRAPELSGVSQALSPRSGATEIGDVVSQNASRQILGSSVAALPKSEKEKDQGALKFIACRARGMPIEHDFKRAYLVITEYTEHGAGLVCSFPACRNVGIRFRYCKFCNDAIARRSFKEHQASHYANLDSNECHVDEPDRKISSKPARSANLAVASSRFREETLRSPTGALVSSPQKRREISREQHHSRQQDEVLPSAKRQRAWDSLLIQRPSKHNEEALKVWLEKVVVVSDMQSSDNDLKLSDSSENN